MGKIDSSFQKIFRAVDTENNGYILKGQLLAIFSVEGILENDYRIQNIVKNLSEYESKSEIYIEDFVRITKSNIAILSRIVTQDMIIPDFKNFSKEVSNIVEKVRSNTSGKVAQYIPQLSRVDPKQYGVAVCTIDNQRLSIGDTDVRYCVQSTCKPVNYCIAMELNGLEYVHNHVGREPSGRGFSEITLNKSLLPHNPMINAGAIMCSSLIKPKSSLADRFDLVTEYWKSLSGGVAPGFNNSVYHSEKDTADRNFALAHFMREMGAFPENTNLRETLDFYFQCCSIEATADSMATIAASFANSGVCPVTNKKIFHPETVKNCLSLMYSCGMYDFSGEFAFTVGLPAKSGVSGAMMIVVPNVMGIAVWSPRLDELGNSVRGVDFCKALIDKFALHNYDSIIGNSDKINPRVGLKIDDAGKTYCLIDAASNGDLEEIKRLVALGVDINKGDYDKRTALHLASEEKHNEVVKYLISIGAKKDAKDRFGNVPILSNGMLE